MNARSFPPSSIAWLGRWALGCALALALALPSYAAKNPYGIPDDVDAGLRQGFQDLFNLEFDKAEREIQALQPQAKAHPMVALAAAVVPWWKLTVQVLERDPSASRDFENASTRCLAIAEPRLQNDRTGETHVVMGTMLGLMSRWSAANRAWLAAYSRGKKSVVYLQAALKRNQKATDAYMTLGTFNYARALIRRWMEGGASDVEEDKTRALGLLQLRKAYAEAPYFRQAAGVLLAGVLANDDPHSAIPVLRKLRGELPGSAFVHIILVSALYNAGDADGLEQEADLLEKNVEAGVYDKRFEPQAHFAQALVLFRRAKWRAAEKDFVEATASGDESNPYTTWAVLYRGYCEDALGHREEALTLYRRVLALKPRFASHDHARGRIAKPFSAADVELRKLEL
jgi:tetratricopeptide (TPR) repeat protein